MANTYADSFLIVFHGPRRGGKTLSAVVQAIIDMICGRKVWSNFPISFNFYGKHYESMPLDYHALLRQDPQFENGVIVWDETALWAFARNSQAFFNKMLGLILTLIGKMELNLYVTVQFLKLLDSNVRIQMDALVMCTDLSFKYPHLGRGTTIGQLMQDISGRFTGETYDYSERIYQRTLHGQFAWYCYNTKQSFLVEETQRKLTKDELYIPGFDKEGDYSEEEKENIFMQQAINEDNFFIVRTLVGRKVENGRDKIKERVLYLEAREQGFKGTTADFEYILEQLNVKTYHSGGLWICEFNKGEGILL